MAKFTTPTPVPGVGEQIATHEGGAGFAREPKAELYITAVSTLVESTFYERADDRISRLIALTHQVTREDGDWVLRFVSWLRDEANMRSVAVLVACEAVAERLAEGKHDGLSRRLISAACLRADEPGQVFSYWTSRYGRNLPAPVKRGIADAAVRLYTERNALRYDGGSSQVRLGDVIELAHPKPSGPAQSALFGWLLDRRHGRRETSADEAELLPAIAARAALTALSTMERHEFVNTVIDGDEAAERTFRLALAGQWEWGRSWLGQDSEETAVSRVSDADQWELFVSHGLGFMAMLRNLRNFDTAGISNDMQLMVKGRLIDADEVARSRQFPFRFYSAYQATRGSHWEHALAMALDHSLTNVPFLGGRTLVLVDRSGSMFWGMSQRSDIKWADQAALFGLALAKRAESADLVQFGSGSQRVTVDPTASVLEHMGRFGAMGGTNTAEAVRSHYSGHDRVVIVTDEQAHDGAVHQAVPEEVPIYTWNLAGYRPSHLVPGANRHTFGGLSDTSFRLISMIEAGVSAEFPF